MSQLLSRKKALRLLVKYTTARSSLRDGETRSPAENMLLDAVVEMALYRDSLRDRGQKRSRSAERCYSKLKFISNSLGILPGTKEDFEKLKKAFLVKYRMGVKVWTLQIDAYKSTRAHPVIVEMVGDDTPFYLSEDKNENRL